MFFPPKGIPTALPLKEKRNKFPYTDFSPNFHLSKGGNSEILDTPVLFVGLLTPFPSV